jgi:hypothetical protein
LASEGGIFVDAAPRFIFPAAAKLCVPMAPTTLRTNRLKGENNA